MSIAELKTRPRYAEGEQPPPRPTSFAPAERASLAEVESAIDLLARQQVLSALLDSADVLAMILDSHRQILFASNSLVQAAHASGIDELKGYRPGEALGCSHAWDGEGGCGTSPHCASCGAARAILEAQGGRPASNECLLTLTSGATSRAAEFQVKTTPLELEGRQFVVLSLRDISAEKRRDVLERVFFHDLLNTVAALQGYVQLLSMKGVVEVDVPARVAFLTDRLRREILDQRALLEAESGSLRLQPETLRAGELLMLAEQIHGAQAAREGKLLVSLEEASAGELVSDRTLLLRVLSNMVRNALEASSPGQEIRLRTDGDLERCWFEVWNPAVIAEKVARQIFTRSFTTKVGPGRGLGTYSMKLFGELFLGGRVSFRTDAQGTVFSISLPRRLPG